MSTIVKIQRSSGIRYKAIIRKSGRVLKTKTFTRKSDASLWAKRIESDQEALEALGNPSAKMTFVDLCDNYLKQWTGKDTHLHWRIAFWVHHLGDKNLLDVDFHMIRQVLNGYESGALAHAGAVTSSSRAPATVNRMKAALSGVFSYAFREGFVLVNPVKRIALKTEKNHITRFLSDTERESLLNACEKSHWDKLYLLVYMALSTGARKGELLKLRWSDVDFNRQVAICRNTKNGDTRMIPLSMAIINLLNKYREIGAALIFPSDIKPDKPREFRKPWVKALSEAGIDNFRFHDLRHSAASYLVMGGATLHEAGEILGHKSVQTTKRYAHLSTSHTVALVERLLGEL